MERRSRNFKELPKRRGGQIWTKRPNKLHPALARGDAATIKATPQSIRAAPLVSAGRGAARGGPAPRRMR